MDSLIISCIVMLVCVGISGFSQILLKKSAIKTYQNKIQEYVNPYVISGYSLFLICTIVTVFCYKYVPLSLGVVLESAGYIFVPVLSFIFLKEKLTTRQIVGILIVIAGVILYSVGGHNNVV